MEIQFDLSEDELPVFMAECDEQLQVLEEGLVSLERGTADPERVQALFRAAHTLKGAAGMIGHVRMVDVTHGMETVLDGLRKKLIAVSPDLIDACLEGVDLLRSLKDEVVGGQASSAGITALTSRLAKLSLPPANPAAPPALAGNSRSAGKPASGKQPLAAGLAIRAGISPESIASAARAFQLVMALQELGEIVHQEPGMPAIEACTPVQEFSARVATSQPVESVVKALQSVSEIDWLEVGEQRFDFHRPAPSSAGQEPDSPARIGDLMVQRGLLTSRQLEQALSVHTRESSPAAPLGKTLVQMGLVSQEVLDEVVAEQKQARPAPADENGSAARTHASEKTIRTSVERLDTLMNLVGELITDRNRMTMIRSDLEARFRGDDQVEMLSETIGHVGRITDQLQAEVMSIRMLPVANLFNKFPRLVRDLARKAGKQIDLVVRGEDTELDRSVIEEINDPLIHLLRNSVDHGIEPPAERLAAGKLERGTVLLTARHEQGRIILTVEDDGRGINVDRVRSQAVEKGLLTEREVANLSDEEALDLIFLSGLSTARQVTDISGRGVGMDIVRNNIERLNGAIQLETWPGKGTRFQIVLPLTLAIVPTLLVRIAAGIFAIPLVTVTETLRLHESEIQTINARPVIRLRDHVLPVMRLADLFGLRSSENGGAYRYLVVVRSGKSQMGLAVDALVGQQEVVVKSLSRVVGDAPGVSSAAILGDGQVALIVDVQGLFKLVAQSQLRSA